MEACSKPMQHEHDKNFITKFFVKTLMVKSNRLIYTTYQETVTIDKYITFLMIRNKTDTIIFIKIFYQTMYDKWRFLWVIYFPFCPREYKICNCLYSTGHSFKHFRLSICSKGFKYIIFGTKHVTMTILLRNK